MRLLWRCVLVLAAVMAGPVLALACGGGEEELDLDEYFRRVEGNRQRLEARVQEECETRPGDIAAASQCLEATIPVARQLLDELKEIEPLAEVKDLHREYVTAQADALPVFEDFIQQVVSADVESYSQWMALFEEVGMPLAVNTVTDACLGLQRIADENEIDIDLDCAAEAEWP